MNAPILEAPDLLRVVDDARRAGRKIAFANGVFDILHVGHIRYLQAAAAVAEILVVGVNGDASVRALKGEGRPIMSAAERAELVSAIRGVGYVTIFDDRSPSSLLELLKPDFHCKGTDYTADSVPEGPVVRAYGGKVVIVGDPKDHSTTDILKKMKR